MSEEKIETKKKEKGVWKKLGMAALAVGGTVFTIAKELNKKKKNNISLLTIGSHLPIVFY